MQLKLPAKWIQLKLNYCDELVALIRNALNWALQFYRSFWLIGENQFHYLTISLIELYQTLPDPMSYFIPQIVQFFDQFLTNFDVQFGSISSKKFLNFWPIFDQFLTNFDVQFGSFSSKKFLNFRPIFDQFSINFLVIF